MIFTNSLYLEKDGTGATISQNIRLQKVSGISDTTIVLDLREMLQAAYEDCRELARKTESIESHRSYQLFSDLSSLVEQASTITLDEETDTVFLYNTELSVCAGYNYKTNEWVSYTYPCSSYVGRID